MGYTFRLIRRLVLWGLGIMLMVALIVAAYLGVTLWRAHGGLPEWNGEVTIAGIDRPVRILRDKHGIPHVLAKTEKDAMFAQGFVHAQDRLWQLMLTRQASAGRLSEWLGSMTVPADRIARRYNVERLADRQWAEFPNDERPLVEAYAAGINAYLDSELFRLPPEMVILHIEPDRWAPRDSFIVLQRLYRTLVNSGSEGSRRLLQAMAKANYAAEWLQPVDVPPFPIIAADSGESPGSPVSAPADSDESADSGRSADTGEFSDSWVVSGAYSESGLPLMGSDPHLQLTFPNFWYLMHLAVDGQNAVGGSVPGLPGVIVGRTDHLAWAETASNVDQMDWRLIILEDDDPTAYRSSPDGPIEHMTAHQDVISVRFGNDVPIVVHEGPDSGAIVFTQKSLAPRKFADDPRVALAVRRNGLEGETSLAAILKLRRARDVNEALEALALFTGPGLSISLADTRGNIAYVAAGKIPKRPAAQATKVDFAPTDSNALEWLPYEENPRVINPPSGRIVTANQKIIEAFPHYLSDAFAPPTRAERIHQLLNEHNKHSVESFRKMQQDNYSVVAARIVPLLTATKPTDNADAILIKILSDWDFRYDLNSAAPTVYLTWIVTFTRALAQDELGPAFPFFRVDTGKSAAGADLAGRGVPLVRRPHHAPTRDLRRASNTLPHRSAYPADRYLWSQPGRLALGQRSRDELRAPGTGGCSHARRSVFAPSDHAQRTQYALRQRGHRRRHPAVSVPNGHPEFSGHL